MDNFVKKCIGWVLIVYVKAQVDPCTGYRTLNDTTRLTTYVLRASETPKCDNLTDGWYRFSGTILGKMATVCPLENQCGSTKQIWMKGKPPSVTGNASTVEICSRVPPDCCDIITSIGVKNCNTFFVYHLTQTVRNICTRYCFETDSEPSIVTSTSAEISQVNISKISNIGTGADKPCVGCVVGGCIGGIVCVVLLSVLIALCINKVKRDNRTCPPDPDLKTDEDNKRVVDIHNY